MDENQQNSGTTSVGDYLEQSGPMSDAAEAAIVAKAQHEAELEDKFGHSEVRAALEGVARGLTMGLSDAAQVAYDPSLQQGLKERKERNPVSATLGDIAGTVAPAVLSGGESLAARAASVAPVNAVAAAGRAAENIVAKTLAETAAETGRKKLIQQIMRKAAPTVAAGATEGALYGTGAQISESALGNSDFNAENILASMGTGAALGGAINASIAGAKSIAPIVSDTFKPISDKIRKTAGKYLDPTEAVKEYSGFSAGDVLKIEKRNPKFFEELPDFYRNRIGLEMADTPDSVAGKVSELRRSSGKEIGNISQQIDALSHADNIQLPERTAVYQDTLKYLDEERARLKASPEISADKLRILDKYERDLTRLGISGESTSFSELNSLRKLYDKEAKFNFAATPANAYKSQIAGELRSVLRTKLDDIAETVSAQSTAPETQKLAQALKTANKDFHLSTMLEDRLLKRAEKSGNAFSPRRMIEAGLYTLGGGLGGTAVLGARELLESDLRKKFVILTNVQNQINAVQKKITDSTSAFFEKTRKPTKAVSLRMLTNSWLSQSPEEKEAPKSRKEAFRNLSENIGKLTTDPEYMINKLAMATSTLSPSAPETSQQLHDKIVTAVQFLSSKLPRSMNSGSDMLFKQDYEPSSLELAKFEKHLQVIEAPLSVLEDLQHNTLSRDHVEAIKAVYPQLYGQIQQAVIEQVATPKGQELSYNKRLQLGILLDIPTDESLQPYAIKALQENFAPQEVPGQPVAQNGAVKSSQKGLENVDKASRMETTVDQVSNREQA